MSESYENSAFDGWYNNQIADPSGEAAVAALPPLPDNWEEMRDPSTGRVYYVDHERQITTWDRPNIHNMYVQDGAVNGDDEEMGETDSIDDQNVAGGATGGDHEMTAYELLQRQELMSSRKVRKKKRSGCQISNVKSIQFAEKWVKNMEGENIIFALSCVFAGLSIDISVVPSTELKAYKELHGHTNVPQKEGPLGRWVNNIRQFYAKREKGKKTSLTPERIKDLEEVSKPFSSI